VQVPYEELEHGMSPLMQLLQGTALFLRKDLPMDMEVALVNATQHSFTLRGTCPHCRNGSAFISHAVHIATEQKTIVWFAVMKCQSCTQYILGAAVQPHPNNQNYLVYLLHYPLGNPDDAVAEEIPDHIKPDFREALRCRFVDAYNATAEMCRRALESSCINLGASPKDVLEDMIDELEQKRIITPFLQKVAHKIRLGGNRGAHPSPPQQNPQASAVAAPTQIGKDQADAILKFTREFFHHVYVVPKELDKYDFSKSPKVITP
jgi:Domain of unknown function (DUF4145)